MQVILMEHLQGVGKMGETVSVARGFARNFLLPRGKALPASEVNLAKFEAQKKDLEAQQADAKAAAEKESTQFEALSVVLQRQASEVGALYGSVKARDIETALAAKNITVARQNIQIGNPIKEVGEHKVQLFLHPEVVVELTVEVERQSL